MAINDGGGSINDRIAGPATPIGRVAGPATPIATIPAPNQMAQPAQGVAAYQDPLYNNYQPATPIQQGFPANAGGGGFDPGQGVSAPIAPPAPVMPDYNSWNEDQVAAGDSAFADQRSLYSNKLKKYIEDYTNQVGDNAYGKQFENGQGLDEWSKGTGGGRMGADYRLANQGLGRNRELGLTNVAEDFASRGMANSGLYANSFQKAIEGYNRQKQGLDSATSNQISDLSTKRANFETDNTANIQAARRDAIGRMMQNFNLGGGR
jgi:hypothetical protein